MTATLDEAVADLRRVNADLQQRLDKALAERDEALEQQTATAEVLQVINASPGDLAPVFDAMLDKALALCGATYGGLSTFDGECFHLVAGRGHPEYHAWLRQHGPLRPAPESTRARIVGGEDAVQIPDIADDELYRSGASPGRRALVDIGGFHTLLIVALRKDNILLGTIVAYRQEIRPFTEKQIALLQSFAAQAVIAMENARLITATREALEQQTATAEILRVISSSPTDVQPTFEAIAEAAKTLTGAVMRTRAVFPIPADRGTTTGRAIVTRAVAHIEDVATDLEFTNAPLQNMGSHTSLSVPMLRDGNPIGAITVQRRQVELFRDKQIELLKTFADQAVIAIENVRLFNETREALEQQTATAEVLGVINSSPGDLAPVFEAMLEKAMHLCDASLGALRGFDGEVFPALALRGVETSAPVVPGPGSALARLIGGDNIVHVPDVVDTEEYRAGVPSRVALVRNTGARTALWVALRKDDELRGVFVIYRREVRPFTDKQIALLQIFAHEAVIAIENARLLGELRERNDEIAGWNQELEARVAAQLAEIERAGKLRRFLAPQLADLIVAQGDESILESHRREIVVVFCDLRGFTGFAERAEAEEVMELLRDYHAAMGPIVARFEGTVDHYSGDGIMVFFNDPLPTPDPAKRAIDMAVAMREAAQPLLRLWRRQGHDLGFGVGIAQGYATLGQIGFAERMDYTAIGTVTNLAARLCAEAKDGQILVARRAAVAVEDMVKLEEVGDLALKGLSQAVAVYNVP